MKSQGTTNGELYREVKEAVFWMETGYDPAEVRAASRVDAYPVDPYHMQSFMAFINDEDEMLLPEQLVTLKQRIISRWMPDETNKIRADEFVRRHFSSFRYATEKAYDNKNLISGALAGLTDNEKAAFIAIEAEKIPYTKVAKMLGVEKGTVQSYVRRARQKIRMNIDKGTQESLFEDIA